MKTLDRSASRLREAVPSPSDLRWVDLGAEIAADLSGKSVLDVGSNAGYDAFMFRHRGASRVIACEPSGFIQQARFLESIYRSGIEIEPIGWQHLDPEVHGRFDLIHCNGLLYRECHQVALLQTLRRMLAPGGELFLGSAMLADPELAEHIRFVPGACWGDPTWWMVPGRLAARWMIEAAGFTVLKEFGWSGGPPGEFPVVTSYFRAVGAEPPAHVTSIRG